MFSQHWEAIITFEKCWKKMAAASSFQVNSDHLEERFLIDVKHEPYINLHFICNTILYQKQPLFVKKLNASKASLLLFLNFWFRNNRNKNNGKISGYVSDSENVANFLGNTNQQRTFHPFLFCFYIYVLYLKFWKIYQQLSN